MTKIAEASYLVDDYWRIVDVLHKRFDNYDWKEWRQSYKTLVLLEFLLTHGPEEFAEEFQCDSDVIEELGTFQYIDERGYFDWGANMQKRSEHVLELLGGGETLKDARFKALKITKEIQGFGNSPSSPCSSTSPSSAASESSRTSSFGSYSTTSSIFNETLSFTKEDIDNCEIKDHKTTSPTSSKELEGSHVWDCSPIQEMGSLMDSEDDDNEEEEKQDGLINGICSKLVGISHSRKFHGEKELFRSVSDVGRPIKKKYDRQFSVGY
ncbi:hypothetical protein GH714_021398 [Hevea brasiliensis]|uniref:ENTH domain-containing protein n=1 Tax=Hevea brasiliensis TaxID=3981 RepID=A0A6A6MP25_HEVBR|nr:hypothetical protein GH714_021398 [Hevea brasiliensis]